MLRFVLLCCALLMSASGTAAQVRGTVVDAGGRPMPDVAVEVWAGQEQIGAATSDAAGAFSVSLAAARVPTALSARRIGMRSGVIRLTSADTTVTVRMEVEAVVLAPIQATSTRRLCPNREDPAARALWTRMAPHYWKPVDDDSLELFALGEFQSGRVTHAQIGRADFAPVQPGWVFSSRMTAHDEAIDGRILAAGEYASRVVSGGGGGERTAFWSYYYLDGWDTQHWMRDGFGSRHTLGVVRAGPEQTVISFCPRARLGEFGQVQGTLTLNRDGTLSAASWRYRTRAPDEDAGGEAEYLPPDPHLGRVLLARQTLFWRRTTLNRYYVEARRLSGWRVLDGSFDPREVGTAPRPPRQP